MNLRISIPPNLLPRPLDVSGAPTPPFLPVTGTRGQVHAARHIGGRWLALCGAHIGTQCQRGCIGSGCTHRRTNTAGLVSFRAGPDCRRCIALARAHSVSVRNPWTLNLVRRRQ